MKPSERIIEIAYELNNNFAERETIFAIMKYLDEIHEQQKPCEQYKCPSWFDDNNILRDCSCGKC